MATQSFKNNISYLPNWLHKEAIFFLFISSSTSNRFDSFLPFSLYYTFLNAHLFINECFFLYYFLSFFFENKSPNEKRRTKSEKTNLVWWFCFVQFSKLKRIERIFIRNKITYVCSFWCFFFIFFVYLQHRRLKKTNTGKVEIDCNERWTEKDR